MGFSTSEIHDHWIKQTGSLLHHYQPTQHTGHQNVRWVYQDDLQQYSFYLDQTGSNQFRRQGLCNDNIYCYVN